MMVGFAIGCLLLAALATLYVFSMRSFAAMANYSDLNQRSRYASDLLTRDIRSATNVVNATPTQLVLNDQDDTDTMGNPTTYIYDDVLLTLTRIKNGQTNVLLTGVDSLSWKPWQRGFGAPAYEVFSDAIPVSNAKLVSFQWSCSRRLVGSVNNSEGLEAAMVELRNR
jgi:Tfp pilus assembly protein PilW